MDTQARRGAKAKLPIRKKSTRTKSLIPSTPNATFTHVDDKLLQWQRCTKWNCLKCLKYCDTEYELLTKMESVHLYCRKCEEHAVVDVQNDMDVEEKCKFFLGKMEKRMDKLETTVQLKADREDLEQLCERVSNVETGVGEMDKQIKESMAELEQERQELDRRRNNLMVFNVTESENEQGEVRKTEDTKKMQDIMQELGLGDMELRTVVRVGRRVEGQNRPMQAILPSEACKDKVLRRLQEMKAAGVDDRHSPIHNLRISSDQTKKQREEYNNLKAKIYRRTAAGEQNLVIRYGIIFAKQPFRAAGKKAKAG